MRRFSLLVMMMVFGFCSQAFAHPPKNIELSYDETKQMLSIKMEHVSHNLRKHHIREIIVYKNDEEINRYHYPSQTSAEGVQEGIPLEAGNGDIIRIKAICSEAGFGEQALVIKIKQKGKIK